MTPKTAGSLTTFATTMRRFVLAGMSLLLVMPAARAGTNTTTFTSGSTHSGRLVAVSGNTYVYDFTAASGTLVISSTIGGHGGAVNFGVAHADNVFTATASGGGTIVFFANTASSGAADYVGGAIYMNGDAGAPGKIQVNGVRFVQNYAYQFGGAIWGNRDVTILADSTWFEGNTAETQSGGAVGVNRGLIGRFDNAVFKNNLAGRYGGAVFANGSSPNVQARWALFEGNTSNNSGGAIYFANAGGLDVQSSTFIGNVVRSNDAADTFGGAIYAAQDDTVIATDAVFTSNTAGSGGAVYMNTRNTLNAANATFSHNTARSSSIQSGGGAVYINTSAGRYFSTLILAGATLSDNTSALHGGAVYIYTGTLDVTGAVFARNTADQHGGAIYSINTPMTLTDASFIGNQATTGSGGAIYFNHAGARTDEIVLGATATGTSIYSGNTANGTPNSLFFAGDGEPTYTLKINVAAGGLLDMRDPMSTASAAAAPLRITGALSGGGIWRLGGENTWAATANNNLTVASGGLELYSGASLTLGTGAAAGATHAFALESGATLAVLRVKPDDVLSTAAATIAAGQISIASDAVLGFALDGAIPGDTGALLTLESNNFTGTVFSEQTVNILSASLPTAGTYTLLSAVGANFDVASYTLLLNGAVFMPSGRYDLRLANDSIAGLLTLTSDITNVTLIWSATDGVNRGLWDAFGAKNWAGFDTQFLKYDTVVFDDSSFANLTPLTVSQTVAVAASGVTVSGMSANNSTDHDYVFTGGNVDNLGLLAKQGAGNLTLAAAFNFTGTAAEGVLNGGMFDAPARAGVWFGAGLGAGTTLDSRTGSVTVDLSDATIGGISAAAISGTALAGTLKAGNINAVAGGHASGVGGRADAIRFERIEGAGEIVHEDTLAATGGDGVTGGAAAAVWGGTVSTTGTLQFGTLAATGGNGTGGAGGAATGLEASGTLKAKMLMVETLSVAGGAGAAGFAGGDARGIAAQEILADTISLGGTSAGAISITAGNGAGCDAYGLVAEKIAGDASTAGSVITLAAGGTLTFRNATIAGASASAVSAEHLAFNAARLDNVTVAASAAAGTAFGLRAGSAGGETVITSDSVTGLAGMSLDIGDVTVTAIGAARGVEAGLFSGTLTVDGALAVSTSGASGSALGLALDEMKPDGEIRLKATGTIAVAGDALAAGIITGTASSARVALEGGAIYATKSDGTAGTNYAAGAGQAEVVLRGVGDSLVFSPGAGKVFDNGGHALRIVGAETIAFSSGMTQWGDDWALLPQTDAPASYATVKSGAGLRTSAITDFNKAANTTFAVEGGGSLLTVAITTPHVLSAGTFALSSGAILAFDLSNAPSDAATAFLDIDAHAFTAHFGTQTINIQGTIEDGKTFLLLHAANATFDDSDYTYLYNGSPLSTRMGLTAVNDNTAKTLSLTASIINGVFTWTGTDGTTPQIWDVNTSNNWQGIDTVFFNRDAVVFTAAAAGEVKIGAGGVIVETQNAAAGDPAMLVNGGSYTFTPTNASDKITGIGNLHIAGADTHVTMNAGIEFSGTTLLDGGVLALNENSSSGALAVSSGTLTVGAGKTLVVDGTAALAGGSWLNVDVSSAPALRAGVLVADDAIINITGYTASVLDKYPTTPALPVYTLVRTDTAIDRDYTLLVGGVDLSVAPADESVFLSIQEITSDAKAIAITTQLIWTDTRAGHAHGTFNIVSGTFTLGANLSDNTAPGAGMNGWDGTTLKKTGTGTLVLSGTNTYTGPTRVLQGALVNTGTLLGGVENVATLRNSGMLMGTVTSSGELANEVGGIILKLEQNDGYLANAGLISRAVIASGTGVNATGGMLSEVEMSGGSLFNAGLVETLALSGTASFTNEVGGRVTGNVAISAPASASNSGVISGAISLGGNLINARGALLGGPVEINATGALENSGTVSGAVTSNGSLNNTSSGVFGRITQNGGKSTSSGIVRELVLDGGSFLNQSAGQVTNRLVINSGTFTNASNATTGIQTTANIGVNGALIYTSGSLSDVVNNGRLEINNSANWTYAGTLSGTGNILKGTATTLTLPLAQPAYEGTVRINAGMLVAGAPDLLKNASRVTLGNSGTFDMAGKNQSLRHLAIGKGSRVLFNSVDSQYTTLTLGGLSDSGIFVMRGDLGTGESDRIVLTGSNAGMHKVQVDLSGSPTSGAMIKVVDSAGVATGAMFSGTASLGMNTYALVRGNAGDDPSSWFIVNIGLLSDAGGAILQTGAAAGIEWIYSLDSLHKRLGEVRAGYFADESKSFNGGAWMRADAWNLRGDGDLFGVGLDESVFTMNAGMDRIWTRKATTALAGISLSVGHAGRDFTATGDGSSTIFGAGFYAALLGRTGWFIDFTAKYDFYQNSLDIRDSWGGDLSAEYDSNTYGLSLQAGKLMRNRHGWWMEPSLQVAMGGARATRYTTDTGMNVRIQFAQMQQYRFQLRVGRDGPRWTTYAKAAVALVDTQGGEIAADDRSYSPRYDGTRSEFGVGAAYNFRKRGSQIYLEYEYAKADHYERPWAFSLGYRFMW